VWVLDEDRLPEALEQLRAFRENPAEPRFQGVEQAAKRLRQQAEQKAARLQQAAAVRSRRPGGPFEGRPLTLLLIAFCIGLALWSAVPGKEAAVRQLFSIAPYEIHGIEIRWQRWAAITGGEVWRLVTPMFLHAPILQGAGVLHVLFNMMCLHDLGSQVEWRRGTWRFAAMVLLLAAFSNLAQYIISGHPHFGGMSGVVFGLLGYVWVKTRYEPRLGLYLGPTTMTTAMIFFVLCFTGAMGPIANWAHAAGLGMGLLLGYAPLAFRRRRRR
jgi:GlpG protein